MNSWDFCRQANAMMKFLDMRRTLRNNNIPAKIEEGLFLGSVEAATNKDQHKKLNITHLLTVAKLSRPINTENLDWMGINILDNKSQDITQHFERCFEFIDRAKEAGGSVLVHCFVGKSRSVTIVVAYLMKKHGMSIAQALDLVKSKRPIASPNSGFIDQLKRYERSLLALKEEETT